MNVTIKQLRAFLAVARTGSFTTAAEALFITQSALSGLVKDLEAALGVRLIDRSTRRIRLSDIGRDFYPLIEKNIQDLDRVLGEVADFRALKKGLVRIAAPQLMACTLLPEFVAAYGKEHPEITIRLVDCVVDSVIPKVASDEVDFAVGPERDSSGELVTLPLFELPFVAVFPTGHPLQRRKVVRWADLIDYPFISLRGMFIQRLADELHTAILDLTLTPANEVAFMSTALSMVSNGLGVTACIPYADQLVKLYKLEMRPLRDPSLKRRFFVFMHNGRTLSPAAESVRDSLLRFCAARWPR